MTDLHYQNIINLLEDPQIEWIPEYRNGRLIRDESEQVQIKASDFSDFLFGLGRIYINKGLFSGFSYRQALKIYKGVKVAHKRAVKKRTQDNEKAQEEFLDKLQKKVIPKLVKRPNKETAKFCKKCGDLLYDKVDSLEDLICFYCKGEEKE